MGLVGGGAVGAYVEVEGAGFAFQEGVFGEEAEVPVGDMEGYFLGFTGVEVDLAEVFQLFYWADDGGGSVVDVELDDLGSERGPSFLMVTDAWMVSVLVIAGLSSSMGEMEKVV